MKREGQPIAFHLTIITEPDGEGFYAHAPALKGLHTCGATEEKALRNAVDAAIAYLESLLKHGDPIPIGPDLSITTKSPGQWVVKPPQKLHEEQLQVCV